MGIKVCPRTGMIVQGPLRPSKFPPSSNTARKKTNNMFPARPLPQGQVHQPQFIPPIKGLTVEQLQKLAVEIGKTIAAQLAGLPVGSQPAITSRPVNVPVKIDESIIDVGIGEQEPLEKGAGSVSIVKEATVEDDISSSKQALKAIKAG
jgi:hypothetical protein